MILFKNQQFNTNYMKTTKMTNKLFASLGVLTLIVAAGVTAGLANVKAQSPDVNGLSSQNSQTINQQNFVNFHKEMIDLMKKYGVNYSTMGSMMANDGDDVVGSQNNSYHNNNSFGMMGGRGMMNFDQAPSSD